MLVNEIQIINYPKNLGKITSSNDAYKFLTEIWETNTLSVNEQFKVLFLNNSNIIHGYKTISIGGITQTVVDVRIILSLALKTLSTAIIVAHNHPSGKLKPSHADIKITEKLSKAAEYFDIAVLDHLILSPFDDYYSFADEGLI